MVHAGETMQFRSGEAGHASTAAGSCERCGYISSQRLCKACVLLDDLSHLAQRSRRHVQVEYEAQPETAATADAAAACGSTLRCLGNFGCYKVFTKDGEVMVLQLACSRCMRALQSRQRSLLQRPLLLQVLHHLQETIVLRVLHRAAGATE